MNPLNFSGDSVVDISPDIFRAYDIRGVVGKTLTPEVVTHIGQVLGSLVLEAGEQEILVARDGRLSGPQLLEALCTGIQASGCNVINLGLLPTPVLYFATQALGISSGVMLTGSHNPADYNGLKIMIAGVTLFENAIQTIYQRIKTNQVRMGQGTLRNETVQQRYLQVIKQDISLAHPLKIVVDAGNGVAGMLAPELYRTLGCEVIPLFCEVDGHFPNHHPDPGQPKNLQALIAAVKEHQADLGLAFDGDGDRLGVVDNLGNILWPDRILLLFARDLLKRVPNAQILFDVKCSQHLNKDILAQGGRPLMWKTGHSLVKAKMKETGALLGGEMSGHFFFKERWTGFDDGLYAGSRLLEIVAGIIREKSVAELFEELPNSMSTPELLMPVADHQKRDIVNSLIKNAGEHSHFKTAIISVIDGLRADFDHGFGLVRCSNTGPNLILRFEGKNEAALTDIQEKFRALFGMLSREWILPF